MDIVKYCELAVSKDQTRYNINEVYRDKNAFVATDGHRLHWVNGQTDAEPHCLGTCDGQYPDYKQVIRAEHASEVVLSAIDKDRLKKLAAFAKAVDTIGNKDKWTRHVAAKLTIDKRAVSVSVNEPNSGFTAKMILGYASPDREPGTIPENFGLALKYLVEAIIPGFHNITLHFGPDSYGPLQIEQKIAGTTYHAAIMPMRFE